MRFMKSVHVASTVGSGMVNGTTPPKSLDITNPDSIRNVAGTLAFNAMSVYSGNVSENPLDVGDVPDPYYWWVGGALWGAMLDYYHYTGDPSYNDEVIEALLAPVNLGPNHAYVPPERASQEGNDDLGFWGTAALTAAERNFPQPDESLPSWLDIGANVFNSLLSRWDMSACGGGLLWQIYEGNPNGMTYKNSISNGGFFQIAARMARNTQNDTYLEWAERIWDWSWKVGFIDHDNYHVYDGVDTSDNCGSVNKISFTYTSGIYLYGAAVMANYTGKQEWVDRTAKLLDGAGWFFSPFDNATDIMYEAGCETVETCNYDMRTFKGYLSRFMWQSAVLQPAISAKVEEYLDASANAAAQACTGGKNGTQCGEKWYVGGYDGNPGLGQSMCALETVHGLLASSAPAPLAGKDIKVVRSTDWPAMKRNSSSKTNDSGAHITTRDASQETSSSDDEDSAAVAASRASWLVLGAGALVAAWGLA